MAKRPAVKRPASPRQTKSARRRKAAEPAPRRPPRRRSREAEAGPASAQVSAAPQPGVETGTAMRPTHSPGAYRAKVRMYRQGLGDCFLISLKRSQGGDYKILIDCGVILGTPDAATVMTNVVDNIVATTDGAIDLLVATHEHWDHVSGFIQASSSFERLTVGEVWLAWTEDPDDPLAKKLGKERRDALAALQMCDSALRMGKRPSNRARSAISCRDRRWNAKLFWCGKRWNHQRRP